MDAKDILGLPKTPFASSQEKKSRPPKEPQRKPDGVSREVYALTGGVGMAPLMPTIEASHLKRRPAAEKEKVRVVNGVPPTGDYQFAKYNKKVDVLKYTDEEYEKYLIDPVVSRSLLIHRARSFDDVSGNPLVKDSYDAAHDTERKRALSALLSQTKQQERKDAETLAEAKRIMESRAASKNVDEAGMPSSSDNAMVPVDGVSPLSSTHPPLTHPNTAANSSIPNSLRTLRVYLRTHALDQMVQAASASAGLRVIKRVDQTLQDLGVNLKPKVPTKAVCVEHLELRNEILTLLNLQKQLQNKEAEVSANRESSFTEAPSTPKRSNRDIDRPFIPDTVGFTGERAGKRDHKRKTTGNRFLDAPPSPPQSKRPRKLKGSD
ncbi:SWR1-complex protein 4 [Dichanthelium oligosanthes]|uniref:SWR1-complex protein 4 n=1 Tax=Dichanthelium oligosanthes TaxID=888268 RepID=A0A1E5W6Q3_9POAL|nr:SWR1-complex protein 4 [Dichanthelium oligosanthes]